VLDTDVLIDVQRGHQPAVDWFETLIEIPFVPGFVVMELIQGARRSRRSERLGFNHFIDGGLADLSGLRACAQHFFCLSTIARFGIERCTDCIRFDRPGSNLMQLQ
jgi:hypothetical protein